jgi:hypothetical protein
MSFYSGLAARCATDKPAALELKLEFDRENDGRWIADIPALPAVEALGSGRVLFERPERAVASQLPADAVAVTHVLNFQWYPSDGLNP